MGNVIVFAVPLIQSGCSNIRLRWADHVIRMEEGRNVFNI